MSDAPAWVDAPLDECRTEDGKILVEVLLNRDEGKLGALRRLSRKQNANEPPDRDVWDRASAYGDTDWDRTLILRDAISPHAYHGIHAWMQGHGAREYRWTPDGREGPYLDEDDVPLDPEQAFRIFRRGGGDAMPWAWASSTKSIGYDAVEVELTLTDGRVVAFRCGSTFLSVIGQSPRALPQ